MSWYTLNKLHWFMTPVIIYPNAEKQLNNSNISCVIRTSRILKFD